MSLADRLAETELHLADVGRLADDPTLARRSADGSAPGARRSVGQARRAENWRSWPSAPFRAANRRCSMRWPAATFFAATPPAARPITRSELAWPGADHVVLVDTPGLAEVKGIDREIPARQAARDADLVLFVVDGPLKHFEFTLLGELVGMEKRVIVCLNKEDWYTDADRRRLVEQLHEQAGAMIPPADVVVGPGRPGGPHARARVARRPRNRRNRDRGERHLGLGRADAGNRFARRGRSAGRQSAAAGARAGGRRPAGGSPRRSIDRPKRSSSARCGKPAPPRPSARCR